MGEVIVIDAEAFEKQKKEAAKRERKARRQKLKAEVVQFIENNMTEIASVGTLVVIGTGRAIAKAAKRQARAREELKVKDLRVYDTSLGHYWELRRKLTSREWLEIEMRRQNGERLATILSEMNVLK